MSDLRTIRRNVEMQGFAGLDDETLRAVEPWLRVAPAICMVGAAIGTIFASPLIIWGLVPFAVAGAILPYHPFDLIYTIGFRRLTGGPRLPRYRAPRKFACAVASIWLTGTGLAFQQGYVIVGTVLGVMMVVLAEIPVLTGFCVPSWFYSKVIGSLSAGTPDVMPPSAAIRVK